MSIDRPARRVDVVGAQLVALRDQFRRLDPEDRDGAAGDVAPLYDLLDQLCVFEGDVRALEAVLLEEQSARAIERRQYQDLLDLVPVATLMTTPSRVIQQANRAAADLLGVPPGQVIGKPLAAWGWACTL
jgi:PAS domain-containing protein